MTATGWLTRGYIPHRDEAHLVQHVVFNLADALPQRYVGLDEPETRRRWVDSELDRGHGSLLLLKPQNAEIVEACLLRHHGIHYALAAWCVMPNHVHVVVEPFDSPLDEIVQPWKSVSAHAINKREKRRGSLWQREYFDRFMRDAQQFENTVAYVENNPVAAGLVEFPHRWRFSSAWLERNAGEGAGAPEVR